jgi:hypothetical protein
MTLLFKDKEISGVILLNQSLISSDSITYRIQTKVQEVSKALGAPNQGIPVNDLNKEYLQNTQIFNIEFASWQSDSTLTKIGLIKKNNKHIITFSMTILNHKPKHIY